MIKYIKKISDMLLLFVITAAVYRIKFFVECRILIPYIDI